MSHLPEEVRVILAQKTEWTDPRELAKAADDLRLAQGDNALAVASVSQYHQRKNRRSVFVRAGATRRPLVPPYEGPFKVLQRNRKTFLLDIGGEEQTVSLDRLKPAFLDHSTNIPTPKPKKRGRPPITREKT